MAKRHDKPVGKAEPTTEGRKPYGWYVTNFGSWFEIDGGGYRRKGGLEFVRLFVSAGGVKSTESSQFLQLMSVLRTTSPERYHHNRGVYFDLVGLTATLQKCYRGWLLDESLKPLTDKGMAGRLFLAVEVMRQAIKDLQESGLIQWRRPPEFDPSADKEREDERTEGQNRTSRRREKGGKPKTRGRAKAPREDLQTFANSSEALNELTNDQPKEETLNGQVAKGERKQDAPTAPAATPPEGPGARARKPQGVSEEGPRHQQPSAGGKPAYAPPAVSTGPRIVPLHHDGDASPIGHLLPRAIDGLAHGYTVRADDFAGRSSGCCGRRSARTAGKACESWGTIGPLCWMRSMPDCRRQRWRS